MKPLPARPEDRRRHALGAEWLDTRPTCFRSEAFAEDLADAAVAPPAATRLSAVSRRSNGVPWVAAALGTVLGLLRVPGHGQ